MVRSHRNLPFAGLCLLLACNANQGSGATSNNDGETGPADEASQNTAQDSSASDAQHDAGDESSSAGGQDEHSATTNASDEATSDTSETSLPDDTHADDDTQDKTSDTTGQSSGESLDDETNPTGQDGEEVGTTSNPDEGDESAGVASGTDSTADDSGEEHDTGESGVSDCANDCMGRHLPPTDDVECLNLLPPATNRPFDTTPYDAIFSVHVDTDWLDTDYTFSASLDAHSERFQPQLGDRCGAELDRLEHMSDACTIRWYGGLGDSPPAKPTLIDPGDGVLDLDFLGSFDMQSDLDTTGIPGLSLALSDQEIEPPFGARVSLQTTGAEFPALNFPNAVTLPTRGQEILSVGTKKDEYGKFRWVPDLHPGPVYLTAIAYHQPIYVADGIFVVNCRLANDGAFDMPSTWVDRLMFFNQRDFTLERRWNHTVDAAGERHLRVRMISSTLQFDGILPRTAGGPRPSEHSVRARRP